MSVIVPLEELPFFHNAGPDDGSHGIVHCAFHGDFLLLYNLHGTGIILAHKDSGWLATSPVQSNKVAVAFTGEF